MSALMIDLEGKSSQIKSIGHDRNTNRLFVTFSRTPRTCYEYPNVEPLTFRDVVCATSIGSAFGKRVKDADPDRIYTRYNNPLAWPNEALTPCRMFSECVHIVWTNTGRQELRPSSLLQKYVDGSPISSAEKRRRAPAPFEKIRIDFAQAAYAW